MRVGLLQVCAVEVTVSLASFKLKNFQKTNYSVPSFIIFHGTTQLLFVYCWDVFGSFDCWRFPAAYDNILKKCKIYFYLKVCFKYKAVQITSHHCPYPGFVKRIGKSILTPPPFPPSQRTAKQKKNVFQSFRKHVAESFYRLP